MFYLTRIENGRMNVPEPVFYEAKAGEEIVIGEALVLASGKLTKCGATVKPAFIAMGEVSAAAEKRNVAVCRVAANQLWEVPVSAAPTSLVAGSKVTLHTDGLQVTATTSGGTITIVDTLGAAAAGDKVLVRIEAGAAGE